MDDGTKKVLVASGFIVAIGVAYLVYQKVKGGVGGTKLKMGYLQNGYVHISGDDRPKASQIQKDSSITIKKTDFDGDFVVTKIWKDTNGNVGAFKTSPPISSTKEKNRAYEDKGVIILRK
jgi:hypothetical protein